MKFHINGIDNGYLDKDHTTAINGIFILFVMLSHALQCLDKSGYSFTALGDNIALSIRSAHRQLIVVMFLFYSGFGVMEQNKKYGVEYVNKMPKCRILPIYVNYIISVIITTLFSIFIFHNFSYKDFIFDILSLNTWYVLAILYCYSIFFITYKCQIKRNTSLAMLFIMLLLYVIIIKKFKPSHYYSTIMCFGTGVFYSEYKNIINGFLKNKYWYVLLFTNVLFIMIFKQFRLHEGLGYNGIGMLFAFSILLLTMKFQVGNPLLKWLGRHLFPLYLYHPLVYKLYIYFVGVPSSMTIYIFITISLSITFFIAWSYPYWQYKLAKSI